MPSFTPPVRPIGWPGSFPPVPGRGNLGLTLRNNFAGLTSGTTVSTGNSGGLSGTAFSSVNIAAGGTVAADNTHAWGASPVSCQIATAASGSQTSVRWTGTPFVTGVNGVFAAGAMTAYLYFTSFPSTNFAALRWSAPSSTIAASVQIKTTGVLLVQDSGSGTIAGTTSTNTIPLNTWFRLEFFAVGDPSLGKVEYRLFATADAITPLEVKSATGANTSGPLNSCAFGVASSTANIGPFWMTGLAASPVSVYPALPTVILGIPADYTTGTGDTGSGADATAGTGAQVTVQDGTQDAGSGAEAATIAATLSDADTGAGTEGTPSVGPSVSDTGTGAEGTPAITASLNDSDTGAGADAGSPPSSTITDADAGTGSEFAFDNHPLDGDSGSGDDEGFIIGLPATQPDDEDFWVGFEQSVTVGISSGDTGTGTDSQSLPLPAATISDTDTGIGVENAASIAPFGGSIVGGEGGPGFPLVFQMQISASFVDGNSDYIGSSASVDDESSVDLDLESGDDLSVELLGGALDGPAVVFAAQTLDDESPSEIDDESGQGITGEVSSTPGSYITVLAGDTGVFSEASNFPGGPPATGAAPTFEGFSVSRLGVLQPGQPLEAGTLYGVQSVSVAPQWIETVTQRDDWAELVWEAPGRLPMTVSGGFMPWPVLSLIYNIPISGGDDDFFSDTFSDIFAGSGSGYSLPFLRQAANPPFSLVAHVTARKQDGSPYMMLVVLYQVILGPISFTGPAYKNGLVVNYTAELVLSYQDEAGNVLDSPAYGRVVTVPSSADLAQPIFA